MAGRSLGKALFEISKTMGTLSAFAFLLQLCNYQEMARKARVLYAGKRSVGDPGLANQLVGRLRVASSDYLSLVLEEVGGNDDDGSGGLSPVGMHVGSIKRCVVGPWIVPVNRGNLDVDRRCLSQVIREKEHHCLPLFMERRSAWRSL
jgi:hypothetical protein